MRILCVLLVIAPLLSCARDLETALTRSLRRDESLPLPEGSQEFQRSLVAEGSDWCVTVQWNPGEMKRFVTWREAGSGFSLVIPLRNRPEPYTYSRDGWTMTRYGPYQPACTHRRDGVAWHVIMAHEQADFPSEEQLKKFLSIFFPGRPYAYPVLSPEGVMVTLCGPLYSNDNTLDVEIWTLTVDGKRPSLELLKPFLTGTVTMI